MTVNGALGLLFVFLVCTACLAYCQHQINRGR